MPKPVVKSEVEIHSTAVVGPQVKLGKNVRIGPYCVVEGNVTLEDSVKLHSHVVVAGNTAIGAGTEIFPFASIGTPPQDLKFKGENSRLEIGSNCKIREHVTIQPGTEGGGMVTRIGNQCLLMVGCHVAHDCQVGNHVIMANNATLAGHVTVGDHAVIGGLSAVHQFVRIGAHAMIGGMSGIENDVIPYGQASGERAYLVGLNLIGLKRRGFEREAIHDLRRAFDSVFGENQDTLKSRAAKAKNDYSKQPLVQEMIAFLEAATDRAICLPKD